NAPKWQSLAGIGSLEDQTALPPRGRPLALHTLRRSGSSSIEPTEMRQWVVLKSQFSCRAFPAELGASDVAAHCRQAPMPGVTHDLFVRDAVAGGGSHESRAGHVAQRFRQCQSFPRAIAHVKGASV